MKCIFDVAQAKRYGVPAAIVSTYLLEQMCNGVNDIDCIMYEGYVWIKRSVAHIQKDLSFMTYSQVETALNKLIADGFIEAKQINIHKYSQTLWYTFKPVSIKTKDK